MKFEEAPPLIEPPMPAFSGLPGNSGKWSRISGYV
jgi:hypothetical protein